MPNIRILGYKNQSVLVEYILPGSQETHRVHIPTSEIQKDEAGHFADYQVLEMGVMYGEPWADLIGDDVRLDAARLEQNLHQRDIWTLDDLRKNPQGAVAAIQAAYVFDLQTLQSLAYSRKAALEG